MLRIESLQVDDHILEKIERRHGISFEEAEEGSLSKQRHSRRGKEGLYQVFAEWRPDATSWWC